MKISHRLRLAATSTAAAGLILALLFAFIVGAARLTLFSDRKEAATTALTAFTLDPTEAFDLHEFHEANPELACAVFTRQGVRVEGDKGIPSLTGFAKLGDRLLYGKPFRDQIIVVGADWSEAKRSIKLLALVLAGLWIPLMLLVGVATYLSARSVFRPLQKMTTQATNAAGANLSERLVTDDRAEFGEFALALNGMLERMEAEVRRSDQFAADAAHELRTPLAIIRARIDTTLMSVRTPGEYIDALEQARSEILRLTELARALLQTARGETATVEFLELGLVLRELVAAWDDRFAERAIRLSVTAEDVVAQISREELQIVVDNLLDNALRFAPAHSAVNVSLAANEMAELSVSDSGPGFPGELGDRVFDRLVRGDDSRNRNSGGAGIGLSVVRRLVEARGGQAFHRETPGGGATVVVRLPVRG